MSLESRKGTWRGPPRCWSMRDMMTRPSVDRLLFMLAASLSCAPDVAACFCLSLPARQQCCDHSNWSWKL